MFCASGAEAVETALGHAYNQRTNKAAKQVLAFEGSFHGRMMVSLAATWNPKKREPFAWPGFEAAFAPYPEMDGDNIDAPQEPADWQRLWSQPDATKFAKLIATTEKQTDTADVLLTSEIATLTAVHARLSTGEIFAILVEPMQCEGGDRYASVRFHQGLAFLSEAFQVPLIYDEIQTGFGLGGEFFWHRMFQLRNTNGADFYPAAVVCAKKAQTGLVMILDESDNPPAGSNATEYVSAASLIRGYIQAAVVDQFRGKFDELEADNRIRLRHLSEKFGDHICRARAKGISFAFDFRSPEQITDFIGHRFEHGLLYYPAGSKTARFRFNLGFKPAEITLFWQQLEAAMTATFTDELDSETSTSTISVSRRDPAAYYRFHEHYIATKLAGLNKQSSSQSTEATSLIQHHLAQSHADRVFDVVVLNSNNYADYRTRILAMQARVYEPARQSDADEFDSVFRSDRPIGLVVVDGDQILAMSFAAPLSQFEHQRGVPVDPFKDDPNVCYMLDLTVDKALRGGLGAVMKQATTLLATEQGYTAIHGRNRDRLAAEMWAINLSLGSFATNYLVDDYPDQESHRDCIYYRCPTTWTAPPIELGCAMEMPLGFDQIDSDFVEQQLPVLVNKMTLSNFVTDGFLGQLEDLSEMFPEPLRHLYTGSGLSECVDKIVKVLWQHRQPLTKLLTIEGSYFGHGSFLARSLSNVGDPYFDVTHISAPMVDNDGAAFLAQLEEQLSSHDFLGMLVEPLMSRTMTPLPTSTLDEIVQLCRKHNTPVVFNETASLFYRYSDLSFCASGTVQPDAAIAYLGGQMAFVASSAELFLDQPLLLISTWEGDAFSLAQFHKAFSDVREDVDAYLQVMLDYNNVLVNQLGHEPAAQHELVRGIGSVTGPCQR